jgi:predicted nucleic acid-binding protein
MTFRAVVADAMVFVGRTARDYLIYAYLDELIELRYSETILYEVRKAVASRNVRKGWSDPDGLAQRVFDVLPDNTPGALDEYPEEDERAFEDVPLPDPKDLHVLASALAVGADVICSNDTKGFPCEALDLIGAKRLTLDATLHSLLTTKPDDMLRVHETVVAKNPRLASEATLVALARLAPTAAALLTILLAIQARRAPSPTVASPPSDDVTHHLSSQDLTPHTPVDIPEIGPQPFGAGGALSSRSASVRTCHPEVYRQAHACPRPNARPAFVHQGCCSAQSLYASSSVRWS